MLSILSVKKQMIPLLLALGVSDVASAADLLDIFHGAQSNDPVFAAAHAAKQAGQEKLPQGRAMLMPVISLNANSTLNDQTTQYRVATLFPSGNHRYNSNGYGVTLVQPLFRLQNWLVYSEAELQVAQTEAQFKIAEHDLALRAAQAYFDALVAQDSVQLADAQKSAIAEQLEQAKLNFKVGAATITDIHEAQARFDLTCAQEISAQNNLKIKRQTLQQLINVMPQHLKPLGKELKLKAPQPADMEAWVDVAQVNNPQLAIAKAVAGLATKEVTRNLGGHFPTVDLIANYSTNHANGGSFNVGSDSTNKSIGVQFNLPLFQGGAISSKWREAQANRNRSEDELENTRRSIATQTRQAYLAVLNGVAQVKALQQALISSENVLEASKLGQQVGVRTNLDVLNAQQQIFSTRRDLYQAKYGYLLSQLRLKASAGSLGEQDIVEINQMLY